MDYHLSTLEKNLLLRRERGRSRVRIHGMPFGDGDRRKKGGSPPVKRAEFNGRDFFDESLRPIRVPNRKGNEDWQPKPHRQEIRSRSYSRQITTNISNRRTIRPNSQIEHASKNRLNKAWIPKHRPNGNNSQWKSKLFSVFVGDNPRSNNQSPLKGLAVIDNRSYKEALCGSERPFSNGKAATPSAQNDLTYCQENDDNSSNFDGSLDPLVLNVDIPKAALEWLNRSVVGKSYRGADCSEIQEEFSKEGLKVQVACLSNIKTLLTFSSADLMEDTLKSHSTTLLKFFDEVVTWWDDDYDRASLLWIKLEEWKVRVISKYCLKKVNNIPFKIICTPFMAAPVVTEEGKTLSSREIRESSIQSSPPPEAHTPRSTRDATLGSNEDINNLVGQLNENGGLSVCGPLEIELRNMESPRLVNNPTREPSE
ncbi:hypothetical protein CCACVL1_07534 [Corchorus capsularis]|uniref:Uncharacterized protein n=1 Tax=Corchorus capsularis TaxID=210143 RepID=A0A1R3J5D8_COCAP|nr:hypothetical protein CCACVL1_07534 [Corchorus capsularis]